jgi:hypothetical protein
MLKKYNKLKVWQKSYELYLEIVGIERMLKALIKSLENKPLNPWTLFSN